MNQAINDTSAVVSDKPLKKSGQKDSGQQNSERQKHTSQIKEKKKGLWGRAVAKLVSLAKEKDSPHRIAYGLGLGIFIGFLPIMGIQMAVVTAFALPLRANVKSAIAGVWISNPVTFIPLYYACYRFGLLFLPMKEVSWETFGGALSAASKWDWTSIKESVQHILDLGADILIPLWSGAAVLGIVFSIPTYFYTKRFVISYRRRRQKRKAAKQHKKAQKSV